MAKSLTIVRVQTEAEVAEHRAAGFFPIVFDGEVGVCDAYAHFGDRRDDPRFVITSVTADVCFAIAARAGLLPHPSRAGELATESPAKRMLMTMDLASLANLLDMMRLGSIPSYLVYARDDGPTVQLWNRLASDSQDAIGAYAGVDRWVSLIKGRRQELKSLLAKVEQEGAARLVSALAAEHERAAQTVTLVESSIRDFEVWHGEFGSLIVALNDRGQIAIGCADVQHHFGEGGLESVIPHLPPAGGWTAQQGIVVSAPGCYLNRKDALEIAQVLNELSRLGS